MDSFSKGEDQIKTYESFSWRVGGEEVKLYELLFHAAIEG